MASYRRLTSIIIFLAAVLVAAVFFKTLNISINSQDALVASVDERGLGNNDVVYSFTAIASATLGCCNNGGKQPEAANKATSATTLQSQVTETPKNGRVVAAYTLGPPAAALACPRGQQSRLLELVYVDILFIDITNQLSTTITALTAASTDCT